MTLSRQTRVVLAALATILCFCGMLLAGPGRVLAAVSVLEMHTDDAENVTWRLTADKLTSHNDSKIVEAEGNVALRRGDEYLKADYARYFATTNWVYLKGNVQIHTGKDDIKSDEAEFDLRNKTGWMRNGEIFMAGPHIYFAGDKITKKWGDYYTFENARVTACPPESKAWSLSADQAVVEIDGYAQLFGSTFNVADTAIGYTPYMLMPAKKSRQSGLLPPEYGVSSRRGVFYNQPYYWAIDEARDLTVNEYWMEKKGFMHGVEYRSRETTSQATWLRFDYLKDKLNVTDDREDPILQDGFVQTNHDRYWLRGMADGHLGDPDWKYKFNLDYVSDQNYLREFSSGMTGFDYSRNQLFNLFGRDLREVDRNRISEGMIYRDWERASVALSARYEQNPNLGHGNQPLSSDTTPQRLPQLDAYLYKGRVFENLPLEIESSAQTVYFHRRNGTQGGRTELYPRVSLPVATRYGSVIGSMGWRQTVYNTERGGVMDSSDKAPTDDYRSIPDYHVQAFTEVGKVWDLAGSKLDASTEAAGTERWTAIFHRVQPRVEYTNVPLVDQEHYPRYDGDDRIRPRNEIRYSVTNVLTRKRGQVVMVQSENDAEVQTPQVTYDYLDFIRWRLESGYDIREENRDSELEEYPRRPFMDMISDLQFNAYQWLGLYSRAYWSPYLGEFTRYDQGVTLTSSKWGYLSSGYSYRRKLDEYTRYREHEYNLLTLSGVINLWGPWSVAGHYYYDFVRGDSYERAVDVIYTHPCYKLILQYTYDYYDEGIRLMIELPGLTD